FYNGPEDLTPEQRVNLEDFGEVVTKDLQSVKYFNETEAGLRNATYALKPFALLASEFEEPILCDADTVFLQDPRKFYGDVGYRETGTLFYQDRLFRGLGLRRWLRNQFTLTKQAPSLWLNATPWWNHDFDSNFQDSGIVLINKKREDVLLSLIFTAWMNGQ